MVKPGDLMQCAIECLTPLPPLQENMAQGVVKPGDLMQCAIECQSVGTISALKLRAERGSWAVNSVQVGTTGARGGLIA